MKSRLKQATRPAKHHELVRWWSVPLAQIYKDNDLRLDAPHYDPDVRNSVNILEKTGHFLVPLSELAEVKLPGLFRRIWAKEGHGYRYVNGTELLNTYGLGAREKEPRYLSPLSTPKIDELLLQKETLLVTCSGTIGRIIYVSPQFDGWVGTHDLIRVSPKIENTLGYLYTYLSSNLAQTQIFADVHGGTIDHITAQQLQGILVPLLPERQMKEIHERTLAALKARDKATGDLIDITDKLQRELM